MTVAVRPLLIVKYVAASTARARTMVAESGAEE
jgi:hypothetical protein